MNPVSALEKSRFCKAHVTVWRDMQALPGRAARALGAASPYSRKVTLSNYSRCAERKALFAIAAKVDDFQPTTW